MFSFAFQPDPRTVMQNQVTKRLFLVNIVCGMDDIPVRMFDSQSEAEKFIRENPPYPTAAMELNSPELQNAFKLNNADVGIVFGMKWIEFADGVPVADKRYFWDDEDCPWIPEPGWHVNSGSIEPASGDDEIEIGGEAG